MTTICSRLREWSEVRLPSRRSRPCWWTYGLYAALDKPSATKQATDESLAGQDEGRVSFATGTCGCGIIATGTETQLTTDGVKDFGYATDNAGWKQSDNAILLWSPDSKKIATFQQDQRRDGEMYLVSL